MKQKIKIPPVDKIRRAFRRVSRQGFRAACIWCGQGYRRFSAEIQDAHLEKCHEYQRAKKATIAK